MYNFKYFRDIEDAKKFAAPERKALKANVRSSIDSLISGAKARSVRGSRRPSLVLYLIFLVMSTCSNWFLVSMSHIL